MSAPMAVVAIAVISKEMEESRATLQSPTYVYLDMQFRRGLSS